MKIHKKYPKKNEAHGIRNEAQVLKDKDKDKAMITINNKMNL